MNTNGYIKVRADLLTRVMGMIFDYYELGSLSRIDVCTYWDRPLYYAYSRSNCAAIIFGNSVYYVTEREMKFILESPVEALLPLNRQLKLPRSIRTNIWGLSQ